MTKKYKPEPSLEETKKQLKEFGCKRYEQYSVPPIDPTESEGLLTGNPDKMIDQMGDEFEDDYGEEKPKLRMVEKD
ncbi:hypothetical protein [Sessilibacter corallicola]|uniref:Uncharacterized protein n=1 Tax=Sessilibacter corallicola TaxID=2904075 RepID=A0ABQ0AAG7_9GAMM